MAVKSTVRLTDRHHAFAQRKTTQGEHASISSVVAAGLEALMQDEADREIALDAMRETIARRLTTPESEWLEGVDDLFSSAKAELDR